MSDSARVPPWPGGRPPVAPLRLDDLLAEPLPPPTPPWRRAELLNELEARLAAYIRRVDRAMGRAPRTLTDVKTAILQGAWI